MTKQSINKPNGGKIFLFWLAIGVLFFLFVYQVRGILLPFVLGALIAYFLDPAADKLEKHGLSRALATSVITLTFFTILILLSLLIFPVLANQFSGFLSDLPTYFHDIENQYENKIHGWLGAIPDDYLENIKSSASSISSVMLKFVSDMMGSIFQSGMAIVNLLSLFLITPVIAFYLLRDWDVITIRFHALLPRKHEQTIREQLVIIDNTLAGFIRGQINVCLFLSGFYSIGLSLVGLKFAILIGIATGFLAILPYVGLLFGVIMGMTVAFFQFGTFDSMLPVLIVFIIGQVIEGNFITPKLVGEKVGLHPAWIIFGLLAGGALFGFVGVLIAVPVTAVIGVLIRFALSKYLHSSYYHGDEAGVKPLAASVSEPK